MKIEEIEAFGKKETPEKFLEAFLNSLKKRENEPDLEKLLTASRILLFKAKNFETQILPFDSAKILPKNRMLYESRMKALEKARLEEKEKEIKEGEISGTGQTKNEEKNNGELDSDVENKKTEKDLISLQKTKISFLRELAKVNTHPNITFLEDKIAKTIVIERLSNEELIRFLFIVYHRKYYAKWIHNVLDLIYDRLDLNGMPHSQYLKILNFGTLFLTKFLFSKRSQLESTKVFLLRVSDLAYHHIQNFSFIEISDYIRSLATISSRNGVRINFSTIEKVGSRALETLPTKSAELSPENLKRLLKNISNLENKFGPKTGWIQELDELFKKLVKAITMKKQFSMFSVSDLGMIAGSLARSFYFDPKIALQMVRRLSEEEEMPELNTVAQIFHFLATCGLDQVKKKELKASIGFIADMCLLFEKKFKQEGELEGADKQGVIKFMWSWCVLESNPEVKAMNVTVPSIRALLQILNVSIDDSSNLKISNIRQLYTVCLLMSEESGVIHPNSVKTIKEAHQKLTSDKVNLISGLHADVSLALTQIGVPHKLEQSVEGLKVDILASRPEQKDFIIEIHGYHHYFRNSETLRGSSKLKEYILEKIFGFNTVVIPIFEWDLAPKEEKTVYLKQKLKGFYDFA